MPYFIDIYYEDGGSDSSIDILCSNEISFHVADIVRGVVQGFRWGRGGRGSFAKYLPMSKLNEDMIKVNQAIQRELGVKQKLAHIDTTEPIEKYPTYHYAHFDIPRNNPKVKTNDKH